MLWQEGQLAELIDEGETIQKRLRSYYQSQPMDKGNTKYFIRLMSEGKVKAALKLLKGESSGGPLPLHQVLADSNETVLDVLKSKHPLPQSVSGDAVDPDIARTQEPHPVLFERIDSTLIRSTVMKMDGAAGPSGLDTSIAGRGSVLPSKATHLICALRWLHYVARSVPNTLTHVA